MLFMDAISNKESALFIAERLSVVRFAFVCMYVYPSHFNCMGVVSVVSSPDYVVLVRSGGDRRLCVVRY